MEVVSALTDKQHKKRKKSDMNWGLFFLSLPGLLFILLFIYVPMFGIIIAFKDFRYDLGFFGSPWVGFKNFEFLFSTEYAFRITRNTLFMNALFISTGLFFQVVFALMLSEMTRRSVKVYQTVMFFPHFLSWVVISYIFVGLFDMDSGLINSILKSIGQEGVFWYNEPKYWPWLLTLANIWKGAGYGAIVYYTALMGIDPEYYEASELDGATRLQQIRHISLPFLKPIVIIMLILAIASIFRADFGMFFQLTLDSPSLYPVTDVIDTFVYRNAFGDIGMGTAAGLFQSVVGLILVLTTNWIVRKVSYENSLF